MTKIIAVYDTNILISAFIGCGAPHKAMKAVFREEIELVTSPDLLIELEDVISRKKFRFNEENIRRILSIVVKASRVVSPDVVLDVVKDDPADNRVLEAGLAGKAQYIVTGDFHLLSLEELNDITHLPHPPHNFSNISIHISLKHW